MESKRLWIWLQNAVGVGWTHSADLLQQFGDAAAVYAADESALRAAGLNGAALRNLKNKSLSKADKILKTVQKKGWQVLTPDEAAYPDGWAALPDLPLAVYVCGQLPDRAAFPTIAVVGTRKISEEGRRLTAALAAGLAAAGCTLVGDTIHGGDEVAMEAVVKVGGVGVILQPCGTDVDYPKKSDRLRTAVLTAGGAILSEFPPSTPVRRENYGLRNRLLATYADAVLVTEAGEKSGTLRLAGLAAASGREVLAVPGDRTQNAGCHKLIRDGAALVENCREILKVLVGRYPQLNSEKGMEAEKRSWAESPKSEPPKKERKPAKRPEPIRPYVVRQQPQPAPASGEVTWGPLPDYLSDRAKTVAERLTAEPRSIEQLTEDTALSMPQAMTALTELELCGVAQSYPGGRYSRKG